MGTVYLADAPGQRLRQCVAIKRIHPHLAQDPAFLEMFFDEATIASKIQHAHVCHVFDLDHHDGQYFIAMEYLLGEPLSRVARAQRRMPDRNWQRHAALVARIVADACEGLHAAHEIVDETGEPLDVVHRDVSPENIFLTYDGVVKIVDFGVASASRQLHRTQTGMLKGKYAYLQPEVITGQRPDRRGDIWGIGVVLWELLTCRRLFQRDTDFDTLRAVTDAEIPPPSAVEPRLPRELDDIVMKALRRDPNERYATARGLGEDLSRFLLKQGDPVSLCHLSEWISELFPGGRARQEQFIEMALQDTPEPHARAGRHDEEPTRIFCPEHGARSTSAPPPADDAAAAYAAVALAPLPAPAVSEHAAASGAEEARTSSADAETVVAGPNYPDERVMNATLRLSAGETLRAMALASKGCVAAGLAAPATWLAGVAIMLSAVSLLSLPGKETVAGASAAGAPIPEARAATARDSLERAERVLPSGVTLHLPASMFDEGRGAVSTPMQLQAGTYVVHLRPSSAAPGDWAIQLRPSTEDADSRSMARGHVSALGPEADQEAAAERKGVEEKSRKRKKAVRRPSIQEPSIQDHAASDVVESVERPSSPWQQVRPEDFVPIEP